MGNPPRSGIPGANSDPFDLLGVETRFDLDPAAVQASWLRAAARHHPDRSPDPDAGLRITAILNEARATLIDPERRAEALLVRLGGPSREQDNALPPEFLGEIFSVREELAEAQAEGDTETLGEFERWAADRRREYAGIVGGLFAGLSDPPTGGALGEIRRQLNAWRYIERMLEQIHD